ncbi:MAG TPA: DsbC family protein [Methylophilaceae bacterium]|nr:DsbC family protein [Methylophilaceae bacterium]HQR59939.1 DsbC family protein [Methylophilaceae bacterium]
MWRKCAVGLILTLAATLAVADEASVRKHFEAAYPNVDVKSVTKTPYAGLYEVVAGEEIVYTDEGLNYLFLQGDLVDVKSRRSLTGPRRDELEENKTQKTAIDFSALPLDKAVKVVRGDGSRKVAVFSDPDCPYCQKLEREALANITDVTVYTFLYPLAGHADAPRKAKAIWCAPDRAKAWEDWMLRGQLADGSTSCETPLEPIRALGFKLDVDATPTLFFPSGRQLRGAYPADTIEKELQASR